LEAQPEAVF